MTKSKSLCHKKKSTRETDEKSMLRCGIYIVDGWHGSRIVVLCPRFEERLFECQVATPVSILPPRPALNTFPTV